MDIKKLELPGLELVDSNAEYSCENQIFYIDFDGAENVSYDNDALDIHIDGITVSSSEISDEQQFQIISDLNALFADTGIYFTTEIAENTEYSTIFVGESDAFSEYGSFQGLSETIDAGNQIQDDNAFVFSDKINTTAAITDTIAHEAGHLLGFAHEGDNVIDKLSDFAASAPVIDTDASFLIYSGIVEKFIDTTIILSDIDSATISLATIQITGNFQIGEDVLGFPGDGGTAGPITASFVGSTLTLSGTATVAEYEEALKSVTFKTSSSNTQAREITWKVQDSSGVWDSSSQTTTIYFSSAPLGFTASDISGDTGYSRGSVMGDVDGDGDLDIYVANYNGQNNLWINDGNGSFTASNIDGDAGDSWGPVMGDVDGDGDLDIYVTNYNGTQNKLWINDGSGNYAAADISGDTGNSIASVMGDIDGDGDLDIYVTNTFNEQNKLWINDGSGNFTAADISGDTSASYDAVMGDVDGDGDLDIYVVNDGGQNKLWINDGSGSFTAADIDGDTGTSTATAMGDVDGDGDLDIYVVNFYNEQNKLWINDGNGNFTASDIVGDTGNSRGIVTGDVDNDGDLDFYVTNDLNEQNKLWINDGSGNFTASDIGDVLNSWDAVMGDVDGDGDLDIYVANYNGGQNKLWINTLWNADSFSDMPDGVIKLLASDGAAADIFGRAVSVSGDVVVIGAADDDNATDSGSAYVYRWNGTSYDEFKLTASDSRHLGHFGYSVAVSGDNVVVGAASDLGAYVYHWNGTSYDEIKLTSSNGVFAGYSVSISGDVLVVGTHTDNENGTHSGSAYVYRWNGSNYDEYKLTASDGTEYDYFGCSVSVSGDVVVVGAREDDDNGSDSGSAYVYRWNDTSYDEFKLTASDGAAGDYFGSSVSVSGDVVVVGAYMDDDNGDNSGSAYVYRWNGTSYDEYKLTASDGAASDYFGQSVSVSGDIVVVGSPLDSDDGLYSGSAYYYQWNGTGYEEVKLAAANTAGDQFGCSVAISGDKVVIGAIYDDDNGVSSGSAYVFDLDVEIDDQVAPSVPDGLSDSVNNDTVSLDWTNSTDNETWVKEYVVAYSANADMTDAREITVSSSELDLTGMADGAWYWRVKAVDNADNESVWSSTDSFEVLSPDVVKLTASDGAEGDRFGNSVAIDDDVVVCRSLLG